MADIDPAELEDEASYLREVSQGRIKAAPKDLDEAQHHGRVVGGIGGGITGAIFSRPGLVGRVIPIGIGAGLGALGLGYAARNGAESLNRAQERERKLSQNPEAYLRALRHRARTNIRNRMNELNLQVAQAGAPKQTVILAQNPDYQQLKAWDRDDDTI